MYEEIENNMLAIDNIIPNHNYKYYMRVFDSSDTFVSDYLDIEDFCEQNKLIVLGYRENPLYNSDLYCDVLNNVNNSLDIDLWESLCEYCFCEEKISQKDYDEIEAEVSYLCDVDFSLEEFCHYLKFFGDKNDDQSLALTRFILSKKNDVMYRSTEIYGASQRDWMELYYPEGTDEEVIRVLECAIFNLGDEIFICPWDDADDGYFDYIFVSYPLNRDCLEFVMNATGCKRDEVYIECFDGYVKVPKYKHLDIE